MRLKECLDDRDRLLPKARRRGRVTWVSEEGGVRCWPVLVDIPEPLGEQIESLRDRGVVDNRAL